MEDLKRLTWVVYFCVAGVVVSLGGGIYTVWNKRQEQKELNLPENSIPVPATAQ